MKVQTHYSVKSEKERERSTKEVRYMTVDEAKNLYSGQHVLVLSHRGTWAYARVNGSPKTWKRDPLHVRVSLKYGMYEYFQEEFTANRPETSLIVEI